MSIGLKDIQSGEHKNGSHTSSRSYEACSKQNQFVMFPKQKGTTLHEYIEEDSQHD